MEQSYKNPDEYFEVSLMTPIIFSIIFSKVRRRLKIQKVTLHFVWNLNAQELHAAFDDVGGHCGHLQPEVFGIS